MATFKDFLAENAHQGFDLIGKIGAVEDLLQAFPKQLDRALPEVRAFQDEVAAGAIYNTTLTSAKEAVVYLFKDPWNKVYYSNEWYKHDSPINKVLDDAEIDLSPYIDGGSIKKAIRSVTAAQKLITDADVKELFAKLHRLGEAYAYCIDAFKAVKNQAIKGRKPAPVDPNAFHSRMGSAHAVATVRTNLLKSITPPLDEFETQLREYLERVYQRVKTAVGAASEIKPFTGIDAMVFQAMFDFKSRGWDEKRALHDIKPRIGRERYVREEAERQRKGIEEGFLHKNALKLSALLDAKGSLTSIDVLPSTPVKLHNGAGTLTSSMHVKFADGSQFMVKNKVIINTSSAGKQFYQFPTTFHDVVLATGEKLEAPSEEKMVKVFGQLARR